MKNILYIWQDAVLFMGHLPALSKHKAALGSYSWGLESKLQMKTSSGTTAYQSIYLPPSQVKPAFAQISGPTATLFLEPTTRTPVALETDCHLEKIEMLNDVHKEKDEARARASISDLLEKNDSSFIDIRVKNIINIIIDDPADKRTLEELAEVVGLSATRLQHLFKEQVHSSIGMFQTFARLRKAVECITNGYNLTDAAHAAGFYDSSHFSNKFREACGLPPSLLFANDIETDIVIAKPLYAV